MRAPLAALRLLVALALLPGRGLAAAPPAQEAMQRLVTAARHPDLRWPDLADVAPDLGRLYAARGWAPLWFAGDSLTVPARALLRLLDEAGNRGLDPLDYDAPWLETQLARGIPGDSDQAARVEVALSVAGARFALALRRGRVRPEAVHATYTVPPDSFDVTSALTALAASPSPDNVLRALEPPFIHYWLLMASLVRYRELARDSALVVLPPMPRRLRPGEPYAGTPTLRRLLRLLGDYRDSSAVPILHTLYAGPVVEAVKRFQMRQGFFPDGVIGDSTRGRMQQPFAQRIRQMELSLERWRWMPRRFTAPPIIVNIPAFRLYAFRTLDLDESTMLAMNVVVGTAFKTETPVFSADLEYLIFSPYWDVTPTIATNEIKPAALKDPGFLIRNRYELVEQGEPIAPWPENIARIGQGVRDRRPHGGRDAELHGAHARGDPGGVFGVAGSGAGAGAAGRGRGAGGALSRRGSARRGARPYQRAGVPRTSTCTNGPCAAVARYTPMPPVTAGCACSTWSASPASHRASRTVTRPSPSRSSICPLPSAST